MLKEIIDVVDSISETERKAGKALTVLGDLLEDYDFMGEYPTKEEARKYSYEARRIYQFINISFDYVFDVKKELNKAYKSLNNVQDQVKEVNAAPANDDQEENYMEQINAILSNMNAAEKKKVHQFALNMMLPEVKA
jgi:hypothetical protein